MPHDEMRRDITMSREGRPMALLIACVECGDALEVPATDVVFAKLHDVMARNGWVLSLVVPPSNDVAVLAPICGGCAEAIHGALAEEAKKLIITP